MAHPMNEKVYLYREMARAVLDPAIGDPNLRSTIYQRITPTVLRRAAAESDRIVRPLDDNYFDFFETRYGYLRQFTPPSFKPLPSTPIKAPRRCWRRSSSRNSSIARTDASFPRMRPPILSPSSGGL